MLEAFVTAAAAGGRALAGPVGGAIWLSPDDIARFAEQHRKDFRYLNRGSVVTAALIDAVLSQRWPDPNRRPADLALMVGSAFGNQGETTRYFRSFAASGPDAASPMASYDVAINAFVNFCSIFFRCSGVVQTLSCGAVSGTDALAAGLSLLEAREATAVVVVGIEHESPETAAYSGAPPGSAGGTESGVALVLEAAAAGGQAHGRVLGVQTAFAAPQSGRAGAVLAGLVDRMLSTAGVVRESVAFVAVDPPWAEFTEVARRAIAAPSARWIETTDLDAGRQIGSAGLTGGAVVLDALTGSGAYGLSVVTDPLGWIGAALLAGLGESREGDGRMTGEDSACPP